MTYVTPGRGDDNAEGTELYSGRGQDGNDTLRGLSGNSFLEYIHRRVGMDVDLRAHQAKTRGERDRLIHISNVETGSGDDHIFGDFTSNIFRGFGGRDLVSGRRGRDLLEGGAGPDVLRGGPGRDHINSFFDHKEDHIDCGAGSDSAEIGPEDHVVRCERVSVVRG